MMTSMKRRSEDSPGRLVARGRMLSTVFPFRNKCINSVSTSSDDLRFKALIDPWCTLVRVPEFCWVSSDSPPRSYGGPRHSLEPHPLGSLSSAPFVRPLTGSHQPAFRLAMYVEFTEARRLPVARTDQWGYASHGFAWGFFSVYLNRLLG